MAVTFSQKEIKLLEDQKDHEQICIAKYTNYANRAQDSQLKQIFNANAQSEKDHLNSINQLLSGQVPQLNQQGKSSGQSGTQASMSGSGSSAMNSAGGSRSSGAGMGSTAGAGMSSAAAGMSGTASAGMSSAAASTGNAIGSRGTAGIGSSPSAGMSSAAKGANSTAAATNSATGMSNASDKDMCTDMLMTEKYVSGAYDTSIFEFQNTNVRDVLNHIQKEEQKHGEAISQYMQSQGMYTAQ